MRVCEACCYVIASSQPEHPIVNRPAWIRVSALGDASAKNRPTCFDGIGPVTVAIVTGVQTSASSGRVPKFDCERRTQVPRRFPPHGQATSWSAGVLPTKQASARTRGSSQGNCQSSPRFVAEIAGRRSYQRSDSATGRSADCGADRDSGWTANGCRADEGTDSDSGGCPIKNIALQVGHGAAARKQRCRESDDYKRPHTAPHAY